MAVAQSIAIRLWQRFLFLGWVGRTATVIVALYGTGWVLGSLGLDHMARQLGEAAILILSILLTALFIRFLWRSATAHHRR